MEKIVHPTMKNALDPTDRKNIYRDPYTGTYFAINNKGDLIPLVSTTNGGSLKLTDKDGEYYDPYTGKIFTMTEEHGVIPTFIPDDTSEPAHIEGDFLVGDTSGRKFPIRDGQVVLPYDPITIKPNASKEEFEDYWAKRKEQQFNMSQEEIDHRIALDDEHNKKAVEAFNKKIYDEEFERLSPEKKDETMFLLRMKEQVKKDPSKITQQDVARLASIMINNPHQGQNNTPAKQSR